ncbi:hypothetical protein [Nostoc sp.]
METFTNEELVGEAIAPYRDIDEALTQIKVEGDRYPEELEKRTGL